MVRNSIPNTLYERFLWEAPTRPRDEDRLNLAAEAVCSQYRMTRSTECVPQFYPYAGLKSTIKIANGMTLIRLSDILKGAPQKVLESLIHILIARASRKQPSEEHLSIYNQYTFREDVESRHAHARVARSRKVLVGPVGQCHDLNVIFRRVNRRYFGGELEKPVLSWSPKRSRSQLGYHDRHLNLVVLSRWLDKKSVPDMVLDYIMYHELLHIVVPPEPRNGRRVVHSREFKRREQEYEYYDAAIRWLKRPSVGLVC